MSRIQYRLLGIGLAGVVGILVLLFGVGSEEERAPIASGQQGQQEPGRGSRDTFGAWMSSWGLSSDASEVERAVRTVFAAYNERNRGAFLAGWTDNGFSRAFQFPKAQAVNELFIGFQPVTVGEFSNTVVTEKGAVTEVDLTYGQVQEIHHLSLVKAGHNWLIDDDKKRDPTVSDLSRGGRVEILDVALGESGIQFDGSKASTGTLAFKVANTDTRPHEFVVMKWLPDSEMEQSIGRIGPLQPGASATMTLTDLTPGRYVILCNMLDTDGLPYSSKGMRTEFTIQ